MPSILKEYEYDIFVSYRQNDNKYDNWVGEFVEKLKQELDATIKDKLTIYFDANPVDGLKETHLVGESLSAKIKSVIFIPIISQTYCDTSSFAWQNEFQAFNKETESDLLGKSVRLANGNFASRILPIKIHELESDDLRLLEKELSGIMRSVDFIYQEAGVNRPLRPVDDTISNSSGILYRNQINKVANAVKEIIVGIKKGQTDAKAPTPNISITESPTKATNVKTTLPESIRVAILDQERPNVFLAWTSQDLKEEREEMAIILQKAGFNVYPSTDCPADDSGFKQIVNKELEKCSCSLHILGNEFGRRFELEDEVSFPQFQFEQARTKSLDTSLNFNTFVWYTPKSEQPAKPAQQEFIKQIRNNITRNMMFSNSQGPMQLVDDMRVVMMKETIKQFDANETDIFFIFNQQDEASASVITDLISSEYPVEIMNILPDGEDEYREISAQQIPKSKLAVVYFKYAADWALPFIKQVWKQVGGASSPTPMMLIGEDDPESNRARVFKAPKVVSSIVPKDTVPTEVKKVYVQVLKLD